MTPDVTARSSAPLTADAVPAESATTKTDPSPDRSSAKDDSLFEHVAWVYAFCRERLFRDDTDLIITALWPDGRPSPGTHLIELGCGPGFYSCQLADRFRSISVTGVDRSESQLRWARERAAVIGLENCSFKQINALALSCADAEFDFAIASRLFTIVPERAGLVSEMHRVLKPGGRCLIAEPRHAFWASIPLFTMWLLAGLIRFSDGYREPHKAMVFSAGAFADLFSTQPWKQIKIWQEGRYQYALCQKA